MRVLVAMDKFKGTASAVDACETVADGLREADGSVEVRTMPMADGGDGTLDALAGGHFKIVGVRVPDAYGDLKTARMARDADRWIIESAEVCGLASLQPSPEMAMAADSRGVGAAIRCALDSGAREIVIGLGGVATSDAGAGMLRELGVDFRDAHGRPIASGGAALSDLAVVNWTQLDERLESVALIGLSDVRSPLTGPAGAVRVFSPQKGADADALHALEVGIERLVDVVRTQPARGRAADPHEPGAGAAGGLGWAMRLLGAQLVSGGERIAEIMGLGEAAAWADVIVTGEGRLDAQSLEGKAPAVVAAAGAQCDVPVVAIVGQDDLGDGGKAVGLRWVVALSEFEQGTARSRARTMRALRSAGQAVARRLSS